MGKIGEKNNRRIFMHDLRENEKDKVYFFMRTEGRENKER